MGQIALPLDWHASQRDEDYLISAANREAFDHLKSWSLWPVMATVLTGPRRSGRSLLGRIFVRKTGGRLFDDAEAHDEEDLFHAWNEAQERRKPLLLVAAAPPPLWQVTLPDLRSRLAATPHAAIHDPDDQLIADLFTKLLGDRGIAAPPDLAAWVARRIERSYVALIRAVEVLDLALFARPRRLSLAMARDALTEAGLFQRARSVR